ncbi:MAG: hypothetical protein HZA89_06945 [Verrucomicrobia bacterium]|nr:hypothetical protein [Verrucomicrobiota bacterium]
MSSWPSHTDYQDAIQNPHICFEDESIKTGEVGCDMLGLPKVMSGNFACVYSLRTGPDRWAIRCFVRQVLGQQGRYSRMSQHLCGLGLPCLVTFEYFLRGIKLRNEWYPIVKMQWVDGLPLNQWLEEHFDKPDVLKDMLVKWRAMVNSLRAHSLAHGDLQHGNIMITPDNEIRLVDYDGMYTPAFKGKSPELGHANFQHPRRTPDFYNENLDNFAALVIHTSFLALVDQPDLFKKFYTGDNVLFLSKDYNNVAQSQIIKALKEHKNPNVQKLASLIERLCLVDISQVPVYEDVIAALDAGTLDTVLGALPEPSAAPVAAATATADWLADAGEVTGTRPAGSRPASSYTGTRPATPSPAPGSRPATAASASRPAPAPASRPAPAAAPRPAAPRPVAPRPTAPAPRPTAPAPAPAPATEGKQIPVLVWVIVGIVGITFFLLMFLFGGK